VAFAVVTVLIDTADGATDLRLQRLEDSVKALETALADETARAESLSEEVKRLREDLSLLANRAPVVVAPTPAPTDEAEGLTPVDPAALLPDEDFENPPTEALTEQMKLAKTRFNKGITQPRNQTMLELLGKPRESFSQECQGMTNESLKALLEKRTVGPITVTLLGGALRAQHPRVFDLDLEPFLGHRHRPDAGRPAGRFRRWRHAVRPADPGRIFQRGRLVLGRGL
jgi:hypothetical protein